MNRHISILILAILFLAVGCKNETPKSIVPVTRDTSITKENAFTNLFLDSADVEKYLLADTITGDDSLLVDNFYKERNYQFAWFDTTGITEQALNFKNLYHKYIFDFGDSSLVNARLDEEIEDFVINTPDLTKPGNKIKKLEMDLTKHFFKYARLAYEGSTKMKLSDLGWFIPRKKLDLKLLLDSVVASKGSVLNNYEPNHPILGKLTQAFVNYTNINKNGGWDTSLTAPKANYKIGDSLPAIGALKKRLIIEGDLDKNAQNDFFDSATVLAVNQSRQRFGLKASGVVDAAFVKELNVPVHSRLQQLMINMERLKWVPKPDSGRYVIVNIPDYKLFVYDNNQLQFDMVVVTGSEAHSTVIFSDEISVIAFSPYWNIPYSIVKKEIGNRGQAYYNRNHYEVVGKYSDGLPQLRQKPGPWNALGRVKFLFPNSYSIYLHDTPSKHVFNRDNRAASHGCIRIQEPAKMAAFLLDYDPAYTQDSIAKLMNATKEVNVKLKRKVPVFICYFTSWVDKNGLVNFRKDIYKHDEQMLDKLFK